MDKEEIRSQLQEKYMELKSIDQQIKQIHQQVEAIDSKIEEINTTNEALSEIKDVKVGEEILVPVSSGIFLKGELKDNKDLLINVGGSTVVKRSVDSVKEMIISQEKEVSAYREQMIMQMEILAHKAKKLQQEMEKLSKNV